MAEICKCSLRETAVGDGCRYCNPQYLIDILIEQQDEYEKEAKVLREALGKLAKPDNWFHTCDEPGGPYTAWGDEDSEPDYIAAQALKEVEG